LAPACLPAWRARRPWRAAARASPLALRALAAQLWRSPASWSSPALRASSPMLVAPPSEAEPPCGAEEPRDANRQLHDPLPRFQPMPSCLPPVNLCLSHVVIRPVAGAASVHCPAYAPRSEGSAPGNSDGCRASNAAALTCLAQYSITDALRHRGTACVSAERRYAGTLPLEVEAQAVPGFGEKSFALSGLSFHSSASAGASPLRVIFGQSAA
jgi:hypothetical protein